MGVLPRVLRSGLCQGQHRRGAVHLAQALIGLALVFGGAASVQAQAAAASATAAAGADGLRLAGTARLTVFGFEIYNARLWVERGFTRERFADHGFTLELTYLRDFDGASIAERSLREMRRIDDFSEAQATLWLAEMKRLFPDVERGDRISGVYRPGEGVSFLHNGRPLGVVRDPAFARIFMGIWLSPRTSEPAMRERLLAEVAP